MRSEEDLTPRDRLLRAIGRRQIRIEDLNDDGIDTIGLDRSLSERVARAVSALPAILPKHLTETRAPQVSLQHDVLEQPQRAATEPGLVENLAAQVAPGTPLPAMVRGPERLMNVAFSPLAAAARALEGIVEQVPRVAGYEPASTPVSRVVGNLADIAGVALPFMKRPPKPYDAAKVTTPSTGGVREPSIVREPLALPPAPPHTGAIEGTQGPGLNFTMLRPERQTRSQLPEGPPAPRALNAAAPDAADFAVEPARIRTPRERALPASDIVPPPALTGEPLGAGPKKLPAPELRAERVPTAHEAPASPLLEPRAAGPGHGFRGERPAIPAKGELAVDRPPRTRTYEGAPAAVEGAPPRPGDGATVASRMELPEGSVMLLDREGRPIVDQRGRPIVMPPSTPDAPPTTLRTAGDIATEKTGGPVPRRAPVETAAAPDAAAPPAPPDVPPSPPVGRVSTPPKTSPPKGGGRRPDFPVDETSVNVDSAEELVALIRARGGLRRTPDLPDAPFYVHGRGAGVALDELAEEIARAQGKRPRDVENAIVSSLSSVGRHGKTSYGPERSALETLRGRDVPEAYADRVSQGEWDRMTLTERRNRLKDIDADEAHGRALENDPDVVRAGERRDVVMSDNPPAELVGMLDPGEWERLSPSQRGALVDWAKGGSTASGIVPPLPLPGPSDDERDTATGRVKQLAQILGVSLPVAAMAFNRFRRSRRPAPASETTQPGFRFDEPPVTPGTLPRFERTKHGDQAMIPGAEGRAIPDAPLAAPTPQRAVEDLPLFAADEARKQPGLFDQPAPTLASGVTERRTGITWKERPPGSALAAYMSEDGRFRVTQNDPARWTIVDTHGKARGTAATFHDARKWAEARLGDIGRALADERGAVGSSGRDEGSRPPRVPPEFARETIGPPRDAAPRGEPAPAAAPQPAPPHEPHSRFDRLREALGQAAESGATIASKAFQPTISVLDGMGDAGRDLSRRIQETVRYRRQTEGRIVEPVARELDRLTAAEKENLRQLLEGETPTPMNARVDHAAESFRHVMGGPGSWVPTEARRRGVAVMTSSGEAREFRTRRDFFPHEYTEEFRREVIEPNSPGRTRAVRHLLDTGQATDAEQAAAMIDERFGARHVHFGGQRYILDPDRFVGGLERARDLNLPGYITDPATAFRVRMNKVIRRFAELDQYGELDRVVGQPGGTLFSHNGQWFEPMPASGLIGEVQRTSGRAAADRAYHLFQQQLGTHPEGSEALRNTARRITTVEAMMDLPLAVIANASQTLVQGPLRTDVTTMAKGIWRAARSEGREAARDLGVFSEQVMRDVMADVSGQSSAAGPVSRKVLGPFNAQERINQVIGVNAGRAWGERLERAMQSGSDRTQAWVRRELARLNFRPEDVDAIASRRSLTAEQRDQVAWYVNDQINFAARGARRSEWANTPYGSVVLMYKSFAANAGRLLKQSVLDEARHGNFAPLARLAVLAPVVGEAVQDVRALVRGSERPDSIEHRILDNITAVGGLGIAASYMDGLVRGGLSGTGEFLIGPALSTAGRWGSSLARWVKAIDSGNAQREEVARRELGRQLVRKVPYVGPMAAEQMRTDPKGEARARQTWQERLRIDPEDRELRHAEDVQRRARLAVADANRRAARGDIDGARELLDRFNDEHGTRLRLSPAAVRRRRFADEHPDAARRQRLSPGFRSLADELEEIGRR